MFALERGRKSWGRAKSVLNKKERERAVHYVTAALRVSTSLSFHNFSSTDVALQSRVAGHSVSLQQSHHIDY